jgi:3-hydroxybutyryl-CoA dehydrogenase
MGQGIATCVLAHGHEVNGYDADPRKKPATVRHITTAFSEKKLRKHISAESLRTWKSRLSFAGSLSDFSSCNIVIECVQEDLTLKRSIFAELESIVSARTILASNTSSLPISLLQSGLERPGRVVGMHWGEPAQIMRYLEIIPGKQTTKTTIGHAQRFGVSCGKEPAVLKQDIRGFLSNRLMYAMLREACHLVESGVADIATVDRSFRNDIGWWALLAGPFRWMDLTGIPAYATVMEGLLPELASSTAVPQLMRRAVRQKALGVANHKGFYPYTKASAAQWERDWIEFTYAMRDLAEKYTPTNHPVKR